MMQDRITELRIRGLRTIGDLRLPLSGLTVLIGRNGVGKSSIIEALEILRRAAGPAFYSELTGIHGGVPHALLRRGAQALFLGVRVEGDSDRPPLEYEFALGRRGETAAIDYEALDELGDGGNRTMIIARSPTVARFVNESGDERQLQTLSPSELLLTSRRAAPPHEAMDRMRAALQGIDVQLPFEVLPGWASRAFRASSRGRESVFLERAERLVPLGSNLANTYYTLRNERDDAHWRMTLDYVRLGLGAELEDIRVRTGPEAGRIALYLKLRNDDQELPVSVLSDGELAYLNFVALLRLGTQRSLLAFDEPDLHLHPGLLTRVVAGFASMAERHPVVLATQSDRLLDTLQDPVGAVRVCELEGRDRQLRLRQLDAGALPGWLEEFRGVGELRAAGHLSQLLK